MRGPFVLLIVLYVAGSVPAPGQNDSVALLQVVMASEDEALQIRQLVAEGRPFDAVAAERPLDPLSASRGGYLGQLPVTDLRPEFRNAVASLSPGDVSPPVPIENAWFVFQMVSEVEARWIDLDEAGAATENPEDPEADRLYMNLAMVQNRMREHRAAIDTYERMLEIGIGRTFLVHRNLAAEYDALGNVEASQRHRQIYLETRDAELIVYALE